METKVVFGATESGGVPLKMSLGAAENITGSAGASGALREMLLMARL